MAGPFLVLAYSSDNKLIYYPTWNYLLGTMIERKSSLSINEFAQKYLFGPLGIKKYELGYLDKEHKVPESGEGLFLRPQGYGKAGLFVLKKRHLERGANRICQMG